MSFSNTIKKKLGRRVTPIPVAILLLLVVTKETASALNRNYKAENYQLTCGYWNDNIIFQEYLDHFFKVGPDDFVTAGFWSQYAVYRSRYRLICDTYYNLLTNKSDHYRFDLFTQRISIERSQSQALVRFGAGLVARGDFGGEVLQNAYHRVFGYQITNLIYPRKTVIGLLTYFAFEPCLFQNRLMALNLTFANSYATVASPSNFRTGIQFGGQYHTPQKSLSLFAQARLEYLQYYHLDNRLDPLFGRGLGWTAMISGFYYERYGLSIWTTENQYGGHNPHYGISFSFNPKKLHPQRISNIMVP